MPKPPTLTEKKLIAMSESMVAAIREYRFQNRIDTESEAIRQLIHTGLAARPILVDVQSMLLHLTRNNPDPDLDRYIEAIHKALNPK